MLLLTGKLYLDLVWVGLGLLQADDIGVEFVNEGRQQTLIGHRSNSIDVPRNQPHP